MRPQSGNQSTNQSATINQSELRIKCSCFSVVAFPDGLSETGMANIPVWVMVVSIMTGLLVVIIITLILWKFGFFERKRVTDIAHSVKISRQYPPLMNGNEYIS